MLGTPSPRFSAAPGCDNEQVVPCLPVFGGMRLVEDGDLRERTRLDAYLFLKFTNEGLGWSLVSLAVPTDHVPDAGVEGPVLRTLREKNLPSPDQKTAGTDSHCLRGRLQGVRLKRGNSARAFSRSIAALLVALQVSLAARPALLGVCSADELIRRPSGIHDLPGRLYSRDRQFGRAEKPELDQDGGLIPVDMLVGQLAVSKVDDHHQRDLDSPAGGRHARQHPFHLYRVGETEDHLVHQPVGADSP